MKKIFKLALLLTIGLSTLGNGTGSFAIRNNDFKDLFNNYRFASPTNIPWAGSYWAYARDGLSHMNIREQRNNPPAMKYDTYWGIGERAENTHSWEKHHHSCSQFENDPETKKSCEGWWGHCNAWAAAAIKEEEPRESFKAKTPRGDIMEMTVADQKGLLTELWMSSGSLFAGNTHKGVTTNKVSGGYLEGPKNWIFDETDPEGQALTRSGETAYQAFWDVSPRTFVMIFTNYVGIQKTGVVIDRFTGDQVWNQPIVGYRLLPINSEDIMEPEVSEDGQKRYPVLMRMKMFWAEDGVPEGEISDSFDIKNTDDVVRTNWWGKLEEEKFGHHFSGRLVEFILFFDAPVVTSADGTKIESSGKMVGEGLWYHKTEQGRTRITNMDNTHPDFIWLPTTVSSYAGNRNPYVQDKYVRYIWNQKVVDADNFSDVDELEPLHTSKTFTIPNYLEVFERLSYLNGGYTDLVKMYIVRSLRYLLENEGYSPILDQSHVNIEGTKATIVISFTEKTDFNKIKTIFDNYGIKGSFN